VIDNEKNKEEEQAVPTAIGGTSSTSSSSSSFSTVGVTVAARVDSPVSTGAVPLNNNS